MGRIAEVEIPESGEIAATQIPETTTVTPQQADVEAFNLTAGPLRKGLRSGFNQLGATANAYVSSVASAMGMEQFAASRMQEAEEMARFADSVSPEIRNWADVKDFNDLANYVQGIIGSAAATTAPALAGAVATRGTGLRSYGGAAAGGFVPLAGEQSLRIKDAPGTPLEKLANATQTGAANAVLESVLPGGMVNRIGKAVKAGSKGGLAGGVLKGAAQEGLTEGAQEGIGQLMATDIDPNAKIDVDEIIESTRQGAIGGAGLGGAGKLIEGAAGLPASIAGKQQTIEDVDRELGIEPEVINEFDDTDILSDDTLQTEDDILAAIGEKGERSVEVLGKIWEHVKDVPEFKKYSDMAWKEDPEVRQKFIEELQERENELHVRPRMERAFNSVQAFGEGFKKSLESGKKKSKMRTALDIAVFDEMVKYLSPQAQKNLTPDQKIALGEYMKHAAMYEFGKRDEVEGPGKPQTSIPFKTLQHAEPQDMDSVTEEGPREQLPRRLPDRIHELFGGEEGTVNAIHAINRVVGGGRRKKDIQKDVRKVLNIEKARSTYFEDLVRGHMRSGVAVDPQARERAVKHLTPRIIDDVFSTLEQTTVKRGARTYGAKQAQNARFGLREAELDYVFGPNKTRFLAAMENVRPRITQDPDTFFEESVDTDLEGVEVADEQAEGGFRQATAEDIEGPKNDPRIKEYTSLTEAKKVRDQLNEQYDNNLVTFTVEPTEEGTYTIIPQERSGDDAYTDEEWSGLREEMGRTVLKRTPNPRGVGAPDGGILTIRLKRKNPDYGKPDQPKWIEGGNQANKINLIKAVGRTMASMPASEEHSLSYVADAVNRTLAKLVADPRVRTTGNDGPEGSPFTNATASELVKKKDGSWALPNDALVAYYQGEYYTWGEIREQMMPNANDKKATSTRLRKSMREAKTKNERDHYRAALIKFYDEQRDDYNYAAEKEQAAMEFADGDPEKLVEEAEKLIDEAAELRKKDARVFDKKTKETTIVRHRPRLVSYLRSAAGRLEREAERIRLSGKETEVGEGMPITDIQEQLASRTKDPMRFVEGDTGAPIVDMRTENPKTGRGPIAGGKKTSPSIVNPNEKAPELSAAAKMEPQRPFSPIPQNPGKSKPGIVVATRADKRAKLGEKPGKEADPKTAKRLLRPYLVNDFNSWLEKNPGGKVMDFLKEAAAYKGKAKAKIELREKARKLLDEIQPKKSAMNVGIGNAVSEEQKVEVRALIEKLLGPQAKVAFKRLEDAAADFGLDEDGVEMLRIHTNAMDPMGLARHEAAHALIRRLIKADPKMAQTLLAAAGSPTIVTRLRKLLSGHKDALDQLSDPEERLAYMYQFWAAKDENGKSLLSVGPNTKTIFERIKGFFRKIAGIWSETYSNLESVEKAEQVFELFESGRLADTNVVAAVLRDAFPKTPYTKASELMPSVFKFFEKAFFTADGIVRDMKIPALTGVMDEFFTSTGQQDKGQGFLQTRYLELNKRLNVLNRILEGKSEEVKAQALSALHNGTPAKTPEAQKVVDGVREVLKETFEYAQQAGVKAVVWNDAANGGRGGYEEHDLKYVENYFPRYYDRQKIAENRLDFIAALQKAGLSNKEAAQVIENMLRPGAKAAPGENDYQAGLVFYAPNVQARKLDVPTSAVSEFLYQDLGASLYSYLNYMTRRAEYTRRFGNQGQGIQDAVEKARRQGATEEQLKTFNQAVMAMEGSLGHDIAPELKQVLGGIVTYQNVRLLPLALFTSLVDPIGIAVRGGGMTEAFNAFVRGLRGIVKANKDDAYEMAELIGTISTNNDGHMLADAYGTQYLTDWQRKANAFFFRFNGMESWNRQMRVAATGAASKFIIKHAAGHNEHSDRYLRELGLTKDDVVVKDGKLELSDKIQYAISQWVDGAVLRPNAAIRPIWMSDPHFMLIAHLKQFTYSFQKTIVARVVHEFENGNYSPALSLLSYVPLIIASDVVRYMLTPGGGDDDALERLGLGGLLWRGTQRAGIFGPGQYALDAYGDLGHGKIPVSSILGPSAQQLLDFGYAAAGQGDIGTELKKAVPGYVLVR